MKKLALLYFACMATLPLFSQKEANIWYFGIGVGLDFNFNPPRPLHNNMANSQEGCASIADNNGKLLFYTNGLTVINRKNELMLNGDNLKGDLSSTNNTIIVPLPGNDSIYYLFTVGATTQTIKGLRYNIINMKGDGGFGEVVEKNNMLAIAYEKLAAVRHCNKRDVWIVMRKWDSDEYDAYLLTAAGLSTTPVVSNTGLVIGGVPNNAIGTLRFSPDGKKMAAVHSTENDIVELLQFDNATGQLYNPVVFKPNAAPHSGSFTGVYAAEFSPNNRLLYVNANNSTTDPCTLYQFDITSNNAATIMTTKQIIAQPQPWFAGGLQTGPDGKIYMAQWQDTAISVIESPDVYGPGCNFRYNKISFGPLGQPVQFGLPQFIPSDLTGSEVPYNFSRSGGLCTDKNIQFVLNRTNGIDSLKWDFGDGGLSQALSPSHLYNTPGFYTVTLEVFTTGCSGLVSSKIQKTTWIADNSPLLGPDTALCRINNLQLQVTIPNVNYLWSNGSTASQTAVSAPGTYWVEIDQQGCKISDTIHIALKPVPFANAGKDTTVCAASGAVLYSGNSSAASWLWSTGETTPSIKVFKPGTYTVTVTQNNCSASDSVNLVWGDCPFFIPNAFTPNGDGVNDKFGILTGFTFQQFAMKIYDRYGHLIFAANNTGNKWDGTFKGKALPSGTYTWQIIYINGLGYTKWLKGTVLLIH